MLRVAESLGYHRHSLERWRRPTAPLGEGGQEGVTSTEEQPPAVPDATPAAARFPLVVYHPGLGGSYEENAGLCEYLATQVGPEERSSGPT